MFKNKGILGFLKWALSKTSVVWKMTCYIFLLYIINNLMDFFFFLLSIILLRPSSKFC